MALAAAIFCQGVTSAEDIDKDPFTGLAMVGWDARPHLSAHIPVAVGWRERASQPMLTVLTPTL